MIGTIKISQLPTSDPLDGSEVIIINQAGSTKRSTVGNAIGIVTSVSSLDVSDGSVSISSGIITSKTGIVTYYGDGSKLQNIISGVGIQSTGTLIGTGITTLNFVGSGNTFSIDGTNVNINIPGNTNISYAATTRTLSSSTGIGTVIPEVTTAVPGLSIAPGFGTIGYATTVNLDLSLLDQKINSIDLNGDLTLTSTNMQLGRGTGLLINPGISTRTMTFPVDWKFLSIKPASIPANKEARLTLECWGSNNSDVKVAIAIQP